MSELKKSLASKVESLREKRKDEGPQATTEVAHKRLQGSRSEGPSLQRGVKSNARDRHDDIDFSGRSEDNKLASRFSWLADDDKPVSRSSTRSSEDKTPKGGEQGYAGESEWKPDEVAQHLKDGSDTLDTAAGGRKDGKFGIADLKAVANDPNASPELRKAAQDLLADRNLMNAVDVAGGDNVDGTFSNKDLDRVIAESQGDQGSGLADVQGQFARNFDALDSAKNGKTDGKVSQDDLHAILKNPDASQESKELAQRLLDDRTLWNAFDVANRDSRDGIVSKDDVEQVGYSANPEAGQQWGSDEADALKRALEREGELGDSFSGIKQTDRGNCVATGAIKAAMDHFGNDVFEDVKIRDDGGYDVTMRDGYKVSLSREEMEAAATASHYTGDDKESVAYANLAYASIAKRAQAEGNDDSRTYAEALLSVNDGEQTENGIKWLGLKDHYREVDLDDLKGRQSVIIDGDGHTFMVDDKNGVPHADHWGDAKPYDPNTDEKYFKGDKAYEIYG